ncbi:DNA N-6-adenine-methyltransferase [Brevundimonas sp.]|uniref:DNA N-6-adenine-methyltransferase n=1 Tax=Brevundimonas sp. TaxID=1871086 RepID=UPI0035B3E234
MGYWDTAGKSDEWYTPPHVFEALAVRFDLDVAHPNGLTTHVPAARHYWSDGLELPWDGFVWMNPPFGGRNGLEPWLDRFFAHGNGVALTPDRTSAPWFRKAWMRADAVMFTPKIRFLRPDGSIGKSPSNGTALWAAGALGVRALQNANRAGLGILAWPAECAARPTQEGA